MGIQMVDNTTNFKYQTSNLLQLLYEAGKSGQINEEERVKLKEMIRNKDPNLGKICEKFSFETQKAELTKALKKTVCDDYEEENDSSEEETEPNIIAGLSSPGCGFDEKEKKKIF